MKFGTLLGTYIGLVALLALTIGISLLPGDGAFKPIAGIVVAALKAALIALWFMELREHRGLVRVFAAAGLFWLLLLFLLSGADYLTRQWH
ncbi:MAG: hypothetical protein EOP50_14020 [Sphingobacteriales bacterium]|nr:MAG: hypothetical protein EOP50_14020 [Sphingobacteriales bacterium]